MKYLSGFVLAVSWINEKAGRFVVAYLVCVMFFLLLLEMVSRYVFSAPTVWASELTQMVFGAYVMLSGGYLLLHRGHITVEIFYDRFSPRKKAAVDILTSILFFVFTFVLMKEGLHMAGESISRLESSHSAWDPPIWPLKSIIPLGVALLLLQGLAKLLQDIMILIDPTHEAPHTRKNGGDSQ